MSKSEELSEKEREVMAHISKILEIDADIYREMTADRDEPETVSERRQCVRWGVDPNTGRKVCLKWADSKELAVIEHIARVKDIDSEIYDAMTADSEETEDTSSNRRCVRWGIDPENGRKVCLKWE